MSQETINLVLGGAIAIVSSLIATFISNYFLDKREKENERIKILENRMTPIEDYLTKFACFFRKMEDYLTSGAVKADEAIGVIKEYLEMDSKSHIVQRLIILGDLSINFVISDFEDVIHDCGNEIIEVSKQIDKCNTIEELEKIDLSRVDSKRKTVEEKISTLIKLMDFYRLKGYRPIVKASKKKIKIMKKI